MQRSLLIKGGTIVDGTGSPAYKADLRVQSGRIAAIAPDLQREGRERVFNAIGCYITPGFIETHNHFDGSMWWAPLMDPLSAYGVTTSVNGNCGFSCAPIHEDHQVRNEMVDIFSFFEDIPAEPFLTELPWDWRRWSEYSASMQRQVRLPVNFAAFVGHIAIRLAVMGMDAWERVATSSEIEAMCRHLEDALQAGAVGLSSNLLDHDGRDRPVPSQLADDAEWIALMDVIARHPGASIEVVVDTFMRMTAPASVERITKLAKPRGIRVQIAGGIPTLEFQAFMRPVLEAAHEQCKTEGLDIWAGFHHVSPTAVVNFTTTLSFAQSNNYVWHEIITAATEEEKLSLLQDPAWRDRARESWDRTFDQSPLKYADQIELFESETKAGPIGVWLSEFQAEKSIGHPSDALAEWLVENGIHSILRLDKWKQDDATLLKLFRDPRALGNISDSGAHGKMFCGTGDHVQLLTHYVRDRGLLTIEEAVHFLTGKIADFFGFHDRGIVKVGQSADLAVFDLNEVEQRPERKIYDVPDGRGGRTYRYTRDPAPMRLTLVNGVPTFDQGEFTGQFPGIHIGAPALESLKA